MEDGSIINIDQVKKVKPLKDGQFWLYWKDGSAEQIVEQEYYAIKKLLQKCHKLAFK